MIEDIINDWLKKRKQKDIKPVAFSGCIFSIVSIDRNKETECMKDCYYGEKTTCNRHWPYSIKNGKFSATQVVLNVIVTEIGDSGWRADDGDLKILDENGFSYDGFVLCDHIKSSIHHINENQFIHPFTQGNIIYLFNLPNNIEIGGFLITNGRESEMFEYRKKENKIFSKDFYEALRSEQTISLNVNENRGTYRERRTSVLQGYEIGKLKESINYLKLQIHKRLNNELMIHEQKKIEEKIDNKAYEIKLSIQSNGWENDFEVEGIVSDFYKTLEDYEMTLSARRDFDAEKEIRIDKVSGLLDIDPYQFELVCANILEGQGFINIVVTSHSNDKGIDINCEKGRLKYVVQCKRYSTSVGSPDMQKFIGAMQNARADKGIFMATCLFTKEAIRMAEGNNIELVDKNKLAEWLDINTDYTQNNIFTNND